MFRRSVLIGVFAAALPVSASAQTPGPSGWLSVTEYEGRSEGVPMTPTHIVEMVRPQDSRISPDGDWIAFVTRQARVESNDYQHRLQLVGTSGGDPAQELTEGESISNLRWSSDGSSLLYLVDRGEGARLEELPLGGGPARVVMEDPPVLFEVAPHGRRLAFVARTDTTRFEDTYQGRGIVYDEEVHTSSHATQGTWPTASENHAVWVRDLDSGEARKLWENDGTISRIDWAPTGGALAVNYEAPSRPDKGGTAFNSDIGVIGVANGELTVVAQEPTAERSPAWSRDGAELAYLTHGSRGARLSRVNVETGVTREVPTDHPISTSAELWWSRDGSTLFTGQSDRAGSGIYALPVAGGGGEWLTPPEDHFSGCSMDSTRALAACIRENPVTPPDIAVATMTTGRFDVRTDLNPGTGRLSLGSVRELSWSNEYGDTTNGWLLYPPDYDDSRRYPLIAVLYGFSGAFMSQAEWISSLPAQTLAADGFLVFLINYPPRPGQTVAGDYEEARIGEGWSPLSSIQTAVRQLVDEGVADPERKGMMGWSYGGFLTQFTLTQDPDLFQVGSAGECGLWDPGLYWLSGSRRFQRVAENIHGTPPNGALDRWSEFSPVLNVHRVRVPLLAESADKRAGMLEFYTAMRSQGKQMELVFYPGEGHIFSEPRHRLSSMELNRDWFNFWLRGVESSGPERADQYARWRAMRDSNTTPLTGTR